MACSFFVTVLVLPFLWHRLSISFKCLGLIIITFMVSITDTSVQFSCSVMSNSLRPHKSQHVRPPCPSPTPGVHLDPRPSSQWCHPAISSSVIPFSSCPQSLPASESFPMNQLFAWGGQTVYNYNSELKKTSLSFACRHI